MTFTQIKTEVPTLVGAAEQCRASTGFPPPRGDGLSVTACSRTRELCSSAGSGGHRLSCVLSLVGPQALLGRKLSHVESALFRVRVAFQKPILV